LAKGSLPRISRRSLRCCIHSDHTYTPLLFLNTIYTSKSYIFTDIKKATNFISMKADKTYLLLGLILVFTTISWISSCTHKSNIDGLPKVCFIDVKRIYNSCISTNCHSGTGESGPALNTYNDIRNTVVPGNPGASRSYKAITSTWGENKMPPDQPLSIENRTTIRIWIEQGSQDSVSSCSSL
jgi:hypothetical protein